MNTLFDELVRKAEKYPSYGSPSYVLKLKRGNKYYHRHNNGQYHFDGTIDEAIRYRRWQIEKICEQFNKDEIEIIALDDSLTRASNAYMRLRTPYRVTQIRMEGIDEENPSNNRYFGVNPQGIEVELFPEIKEPGYTEIYWLMDQEVPFRLFGKVSEFLD